MHSKAPTAKLLSENARRETLLAENAAGKVDKNCPKSLQASQEKSLIRPLQEEKLLKIRKSFLARKSLPGTLPAKNILKDKAILRFCILACFLLHLHSASCEQPVSRRATRQSGILSDLQLLEWTQKQTFLYFWTYGHPVSGLARERTNMGFGSGEVVTTGGSGFGIMSIVVAAERRWISRQQAADRVDKILQFLRGAERFHGVFPHWMNGTSGKLVPFYTDDHAGDLVETAFLVQGLLTARQYFNTASSATEARIRSVADQLWKEVEWTWHMPEGEQVLTWEDPHQPGIESLKLEGWNEGMITYILAAASPTYPIDAEAYHKGWARDGDFRNGKDFYGIRLLLGSDYGGPLFFAHYSFLGLDPRGLQDQYADYWGQNVNHTLINYEHCVRNPKGFKGYSDVSWGLTASTSPDGYRAHSPTNDVGTIAPTAALSSMPYTPEKSMRALRHFYQKLGFKLRGEYGFKDAFNEGKSWYSDAFLAIDQGPIILMIENYRTGLLWKLFMSCPEVQAGLQKLGFQSPYLNSGKR